MVNRFKGDLAELLAIAPCLELIETLKKKDHLPSKLEVYFGETIQERLRVQSGSIKRWGSFAKGADGLIVEHSDSGGKPLNVLGVIEVKSMMLPPDRIWSQIEQHLGRMRGGLMLNNDLWDPNQIALTHPLRLAVVPSRWKLSREWRREESEISWKLIVPEHVEPPVSTYTEKVGNRHWRIVLNWSQEALEQAAYEMTFWYMSQVGKVIYEKRPLPTNWEGMTPEEAGYNSIKMMLYYVILRYITPRQGQHAIKLYNAYCFGYPFAADANDMLWPEDFSVQGS
jgi:hypothetical protein